MPLQRKYFKSKFNWRTNKLIRDFCISANALILVFAIFNTLNIVHAHNTHSWETYLEYYKKGDCKKILQRLKYLSKPKEWADDRLWSRSRIIQSKCHLKLGNYEKALKSIKLIPQSKIKDAWLFQKIRILLHASRHREALDGINELLQHHKREFYLVSLRDELKKSFHTDKEIKLIFYFLHETRKYKKWFLNDYILHSLYMKGAELNGEKIKHEYKILGWQNPIDEASARLSHKQLKKADLKNLNYNEINDRVRKLKKLGLNKYLIEHLPQLNKGLSIDVANKLG